MDEIPELEGDDLTIANTQQAEEEKIFEMENVVGLGVGRKIKGDRETDEPCLSVLVTQKMPQSLLRSRDRIPKSISNVKTDVIETGDIFAGQRPQTNGHGTEAAAPFPEVGDYEELDDEAGVEAAPGPSSARTARLQRRTLPCDRRNDRRGGGGSPAVPGDSQTLPAAEQQPRPGQLQRCPDRGSDPSARKGRWRSLPRGPDRTALPLRSHPLRPRTVELRRCRRGGDRVPRSGSRNLLDRRSAGDGERQAARDRAEDRPDHELHDRPRHGHQTPRVNVNYGRSRIARFVRQIVTTDMSAGGDSGSLVLDQADRAVGLLFAGSSRATILNPIQLVEAQLGIRVGF